MPCAVILRPKALSRNFGDASHKIAISPRGARPSPSQPYCLRRCCAYDRYHNIYYNIHGHTRNIYTTASFAPGVRVHVKDLVSDSFGDECMLCLTKCRSVSPKYGV